MRDEDFFTEVQARAGLRTPDDVDCAVRATLAVLGDRLPDEVVAAVAAALPERLGEQLWSQRPRTRVTGAQAGRLSRGLEQGEGSWPGDSTSAGVDIDSRDTSATD